MAVDQLLEKAAPHHEELTVDGQVSLAMTEARKIAAFEGLGALERMKECMRRTSAANQIPGVDAGRTWFLSRWQGWLRWRCRKRATLWSSVSLRRYAARCNQTARLM